MLRKLWKRTITAVVVVLVVVAVKLWEVASEDAWSRRQLKPIIIRYPHGVLSHHRALYPEKSQWMLKEQTGSSPKQPSQLHTHLSQSSMLSSSSTSHPTIVKSYDHFPGQKQYKSGSEEKQLDSLTKAKENHTENTPLSTSTPRENNSQALKRASSTLYPPSTIEPQSPRFSRDRGFVLAMDYWEQQTSASRNLQNLQCWAAQLNLSVVEPAMVGSQLRFPLSTHPNSKGFWFREVFNIEMWNRLSSRVGHSTLVPWESFIRKAPRNVILVSFKYAFHEEVKKRLNMLDTHNYTHPPLPPSERFKQDCGSNKWSHTAAFQQFFSRHQFQVVREVCFNFAFGDKLSRHQFTAHLYGNQPPNNSTVIYQSWRGTGPHTRVLILKPDCGNTGIQEEIAPSPHILQKVVEYQKTYLKAQPYIAIMGRMEKVKKAMQSRKHGRLSLAECFSKLLAAWGKIRAQSGLNQTFLAMDIGRFGSHSFINGWNGSDLRAEFETFFKALYGGVGGARGRAATVKEWEKTFEETAKTSDPGYVALLQKVLVAQARCVLFIGGGSFQKHALHLYRTTHPHAHSQCVKIVRECTPSWNV